MYFNQFFKKYYIYLSIICISVFLFNNSITSLTSSHNQSLEQLEEALINWYYKYNPTVATEHHFMKYNNEIGKYNTDSIEEYKTDINRFIIELSQIDQTKLNESYIEKYVITEQFLSKIDKDIKNFNYYSYNPGYYLEELYNSLFFIIYNKKLNMDKKINSLLYRLESIPNQISNIEKNLIYYSNYDIEESLQLINQFEKLLDNLPEHIISDMTTLDDINIDTIEIKKSLRTLKNYIQNNINNKNKINKKVIINNYLSYNKDINFQLDYSSLVQELHKKMINIALPIYMLNNDEPVWIDKEDTLKIINSTLEELTIKYPTFDSQNNNDLFKEDEILINLNESFDRIKSFSMRFPELSENTNYNYEIIKDDIYLKRNKLYRLWHDQSTIYLFLNYSYYNEDNLFKDFNKYKFDLYNINNCFPGRYFQRMTSRNDELSINNIIINQYTNFGWGLFSEYIFINKGYGGKNKNLYMLTHLENILELVIKNMIFNNYYIEEKPKEKNEIITEIYQLTLYNKDRIEKILSDVIASPMEPNFEIIGYFKLKEMYNKFIADNPSDESQFYYILLHNAYLSTNLIKEFRLNSFYE